MLDDVEKSALRTYVAAGNTVMINGTDVSGLPDAPNVVRFRDNPGKAYMMALEQDFEHAATDSQKSFLAVLKTGSEISVEAPLEVVTNIAEVDGKECVFIANFTGLRGHENPVQSPVNVRISFSGRRKQAVSFLPFLGEAQEIHAEQPAGNSIFTLPAIEKGGVACAEEH